MALSFATCPFSQTFATGRIVAKSLCAAALLGLGLAASACDAHSHAKGPAEASPLGVVSAATPRFPVARFPTGGTYPQFRDGTVLLRGVNRAFRAAILTDQRAFEPYARRYAKHVAGRRLPSRYAGYYQTELDRTLISASSTVVSALIPRTRAVLPLRSRSDGWLGITIRVASGARVALPELFARRAGAMRVLEAHVRSDKLFVESLRRHPAAALRNARFALLPTGLAVGVVGPAYQDDVIVPYLALRPYLSQLGLRLATGARWPDYRPDRANLSYCRRPALSLAELSATGDVPCTTARKVEAAVFSQRCDSKNRCVASGFTCLAFWDGRYDRPFDYTHHAVCHDGTRRIEMDEG
jgi:hypothetical protein